MFSKINIQSRIKDYSVEFVDSLDDIIDISNENNTIVYIDKNISDLYPILKNQKAIEINCIESNKNLDGCQQIFDTLSKNKANIKTKIVAIGGGILQDLVGFCSSTFCRGIEYILVPTTLLSQADSCIGGKTSLNFKSIKNILGTFYPPSKILIYKDFYKTLSNLDFISGYGEIYKFHILQNMSFVFSESNIEKLIYDSLLFKADILMRDEFDTGERKILNFGHTLGHALETTSDYNIPHGIGVIIGSMVALKVSKYHEYNISLYNHYIDAGISLIKQSKINFDESWFDFNNLLKVIKSDKKNTGQLNMILINQDKPVIMSVSDIGLIERSVKEVYESL